LTDDTSLLKQALRRYREKMTPLNSLEHKKVIFFDMNRTLLDPQQAFRDSFLETLQEYTGRWQENEDFAADKVLETYLEQWKKQRQHLLWSKFVATA
jgi:FMN phosphatase YigB (HAD superfamily)